MPNDSATTSESTYLRIPKLTTIRAIIVVLLIYLIHFCTLARTDEWETYLSTPDGVPGAVAGMITVVCGIVFLNYLRGSVKRTIEITAGTPIAAELDERQSRIFALKNTLLWSSALSLIMAGIFVFFWLVEIVPFKSLTWLIGGIVCGSMSMFSLMNVMLPCLRVCRFIMDTNNIESSIDAHEGYTLHPARVLAKLGSWSCAIPLITLSPWSYYLFMQSSLDQEQVLLVIEISVFILFVMLGAYSSITYKMYVCMSRMRERILQEIEQEYADIFKRCVTLKEKDAESFQKRLEVLEMLRKNAQRMPRWPSGFDAILKIGGSVTVAMYPQTLVLLRALGLLTDSAS